MYKTIVLWQPTRPLSIDNLQDHCPLTTYKSIVHWQLTRQLSIDNLQDNCPLTTYKTTKPLSIIDSLYNTYPLVVFNTYYGLILCDIQLYNFQMEIDQYDITIAIHYDITMGNDIARDVHCEITIGNDIARDTHCDITMSNDIAMYTYHGITMHNDVAMNLFYCIYSALCLIIILLWVVCNKNKNKFMFDQSGLENTFVIFV